MTAWRWAAIALVVVGTIGVLWLAFMRQPYGPAAATGPIVLVSGRDDHGLLAQPMVPLSKRPGQTGGGAALADATFVRVLDERGEWLYVQSIANPQAVGWINDYHLRNRALNLDTGVQVRFVNARLVGGQVEVAVQPVDGSESAAWVSAEHLREVGAQAQPDHHDHHHTP